MKLSVTVITRNEAEHIKAALESVSWADELIVVDAESTDDTVAIARQFTERVVVRQWPGYIEQKNYAASLAANDWIFSLDADERVTPALASEIATTLEKGPSADGYQVPRVSWYLDRWVRCTDWYPDYQLRLYDRRRGRWTGRYVHEALSVDGRVSRLRGELQHFPYRDLSDHLATIDQYSTYAARQMFESGRRAGWLELALYPRTAFVRNLVLRGGFREGHAGLIISRMNAYYVFLKFAKLWELQQREVPGSAFPVPASSVRTRHPEPGT